MKKKQVVMRWNVLYLMSLGYGILAILFGIIAATKDMTAVDAWNMLEAPLMALIGGTLAISKDLITGDDHPENPSPGEDTDDLKNKETKTGQQETSGEDQ